jgi:hypothetical protein
LGTFGKIKSFQGGGVAKKEKKEIKRGGGIAPFLLCSLMR